MDRTEQIIKVIEKYPGIKFREIMRETGMKNGVLEHYTFKMEKEGTVKVERTPGQTRYYPPGLPNEDVHLIKNLRQETPRQILASLLQLGFLSFRELTGITKKAPATVSSCLAQLVRDDLVETAIVDSKKKYFVKDPKRLQSIIGKYHPNLIERSAERLADNFSLL